jgi:hypothetical protein
MGNGTRRYSLNNNRTRRNGKHFSERGSRENLDRYTPSAAPRSAAAENVT